MTSRAGSYAVERPGTAPAQAAAAGYCGARRPRIAARCTQPTEAPSRCPQVNKRVLKLVWDMLRPESLPRGWSARFDAGAGRWCVPMRTRWRCTPCAAPPAPAAFAELAGSDTPFPPPPQVVRARALRRAARHAPGAGLLHRRDLHGQGRLQAASRQHGRAPTDAGRGALRCAALRCQHCTSLPLCACARSACAHAWGVWHACSAPSSQRELHPDQRATPATHPPCNNQTFEFKRSDQGDGHLLWHPRQRGPVHMGGG